MWISFEQTAGNRTAPVIPPRETAERASIRPKPSAENLKTFRYHMSLCLVVAHVRGNDVLVRHLLMRRSAGCVYADSADFPLPPLPSPPSPITASFPLPLPFLISRMDPSQNPLSQCTVQRILDSHVA